MYQKPCYRQMSNKSIVLTDVTKTLLDRWLSKSKVLTDVTKTLLQTDDSQKQSVDRCNKNLLKTWTTVKGTISTLQQETINEGMVLKHPKPYYTQLLKAYVHK